MCVCVCISGALVLSANMQTKSQQMKRMSKQARAGVRERGSAN